MSTVTTSRFPSTNNQLRTSSNLRNQATIQDGMVTVQQVQGRHGQSFAGTGTKGNATSSGGNNIAGQERVVKCYNCQGEGHMARQCTQPKRLRNSAWFKEKILLVQAQKSGQTDDLDAYDSDCDDISSAKAVLMANLSSYDSDVFSEVPQHDSYQNNDMINQSVQETQYFEQSLIDYVLDNEITSDSNIISYEQYLQETHNAIVQDTNSSAQQDAMIMSVFEQMSNQVTNSDKINQENKIVNESLTVELKRYKERVKTFEQRLNIDLSSREKIIDSQMDDMIRNRNALKQEVDSLKQTLSKHVKEKESLLQTFTVFKNESKEKENKYMDKKIDLEKKIKELDNIVYKVGQSAQMRIKPTLYDGSVISKKHDVIFVVDEEETLMLKEESRSKMLAKQNDPISKEKKINISPINYSELNKLAEDFGKCFVPQKELSAEQAFWLPISNPISKQPVVQTTLVRTEAPSELPKVSMVKTSFQKLKNHLASFDKVVKVQTTPDAITEGFMGELFNDFDNGLNLELNEVKKVFNQMEAAVEQCYVEKKYFDIQKKELFLDNDRLLEHVICQDVMNIVIHADSIPVNVLPANNKYIVHTCVNSLATRTNCREMQQIFINEYNENLVLKAELAKMEHMVEKKVFDEVVLRSSRLENCCVNLELKLQHQKESFLNNKPLNNQDAPEIQEFFHINEWQAKLKAKDVSIANLKKLIENLKGKNVVEKAAPTEQCQFEHTRAVRPLDSDLDYACKYAKRIKEVLVYVTTTCPSLTKSSEKLVTITPLNKNKKVRYRKEEISCSMQSQPSGITKNNRTSKQQVHHKNKVKDHPRPEPQLLTPETISSGLVPNPHSLTPYVPPTKKHWDILFQPMFDEYFNPSTSVASPVLAVVAPEPADSTGTPSSTTIDQDAPSPSTSQTPQETQSPVIPSGLEEEFHDIEVAHLDNDPLFGVPIPEPNSKESSSRDVIQTNVHSVNQPPEHLRK
ncbi:retrovirus-related pol polyprotein from transposon TNT 1-94 [Tanacetum coccineum]